MCPEFEAVEFNLVASLEIARDTVLIVLGPLVPQLLVVTSMSAIRVARLINESRSEFSVGTTLEAMGIEEVLSAPRSPWQNPHCERVIGTLRRELLDNVIVFNEAHARWLLKQYVAYYNGSRTHLSLAKDPDQRAVELPSVGPVCSADVLGGLHHRYSRRAA